MRSRGASGSTGSTGALGRGGRMLGEIEECFIEGLVPGDTFVFGGEVVRYEALTEDEVYVSRANDKDPKMPSYMGGKFPLSTYLAERVRELLADPSALERAAGPGARLAVLQRPLACRRRDELLVETFPRGGRTTWSAIPSRGGWRTRRSACC